MEKLLIKNMVCHRCILSVEEILSRHKINYENVIVGEVFLQGEIDDSSKEKVRNELVKIGLELIDTKGSGLIEKTKNLIIKKARNEVEEKDKKIKLSNYLSNHLNYEYSYLSNLFSTVEGKTIEKFYIEHRIEKAKELLVYGQLNLSEIAYELDYSSVAHLSTQFKKETGLTPSHFKKVGAEKRKRIDNI